MTTTLAPPLFLPLSPPHRGVGLPDRTRRYGRTDRMNDKHDNRDDVSGSMLVAVFAVLVFFGVIVAAAVWIVLAVAG